MTLWLRDARWIDPATHAIRAGHLAVDAGEAVEPGARSGGTPAGVRARPPGSVRFVDTIPSGAETYDCAGRLVTRAFANAHHHVYSALARGMPAPPRTPTSFVEILQLVWWRLDKALDEPMIRASARAVAVDALRCGCTFVIDHHASPNAASGSLHALAEEFDALGVGHLLCYELSDRDGPERLTAALDETDAFLRTHPGLVGLHASFTVSDALLERAAELAVRHATGVHVHVAEAASDEEHCRRVHDTTVVERFARAGLLDSPRTLLVHGLHLDDDERARIAASPAWVVQNPESNRHNAVGLFDPRGLGERILLGTDGMHSDMLASARAAYLDGQQTGGCPPDAIVRRLRRVHEYLAQGGFAGDGADDLVVLDDPSPTPITQANWSAHVLYGLAARHVHAVIRGGRLVVERGEVLGVDTERILAQAREQAARLWRRLA